MSAIKPINPGAHRQHGWKRHTDMWFTAKDGWVPVLLTEVPVLLGMYPLAVRRDGGGRNELVALLGLQDGENLFLSPAGKWLMPYVPSAYRGYPFQLQTVEVDGAPRAVLGFDHDSGLYRECPEINDKTKREERFFQDGGDLSPMLSRLLTFLTKCAEDKRRTLRCVDLLDQKGLLDDWDIGAALQAEEVHLDGMRRIDMAALHALEGEDLSLLQRNGALELAYAQHFSIQRLGVLTDLRARRGSKPRESAQTDNLDHILGYESDLLQFD